MSKAEEKTTELMKKAKDFIPDGGYSEKELNLAFFMFIKGYHQAEKDLELTYDDICEIMEIREDVLETDSYENLYEEILKRFKERRKNYDEGTST